MQQAMVPHLGHKHEATSMDGCHQRILGLIIPILVSVPSNVIVASTEMVLLVYKRLPMLGLKVLGEHVLFNLQEHADENTVG